MSRISCNVTKDLLAPYLDGVCSGESRELVEEHLQECASCRQFLAKLQERDRGREAQELDYLKKIRNAMDFRSMLGILVPLILLFVNFLGLNTHGSMALSFYHVEMPLLMLIYALALGNDKKCGMPEGKEWALPVLGAATVCAAIGWQYVSLNKIDVILGPYIYRGALAIAAAAVLILAALVVIAKKKNRVFPVTQNLAWLSLNLALSFGAMLHTMLDMEQMSARLLRNGEILAAEFVVATALLLFWQLKPGRTT